MCVALVAIVALVVAMMADESPSELAVADGVVADDATLELCDLAQEGLVNLLKPHAEGAFDGSAEGLQAVEQAWAAAGELPPQVGAAALAASDVLWPNGIPAAVRESKA